MNHLGTKKLQTDRLILRKLTIDDANDMFNNWANDEKVSKYMQWSAHKSIDETNNILSKWIKEYNEKNYYQWGIVLKENNNLIGTISVVRIDEKVEEVEIGYCIGYKYWNQNITSEALKEVIRFMFEEVHVNKVSACHDVDNFASGKVMIKNKMKYEGTLRAKFKTSNNKICDASFYSILKNEYKKGE